MATSTRVSGFQPGGHAVLRRSRGPEQQRVLAGPTRICSNARCASRWPPCWTPLPRSTNRSRPSASDDCYGRHPTLFDCTLTSCSRVPTPSSPALHGACTHDAASASFCSRRKRTARHSACAWDVHAVHGMHAMHSVSEPGTARRLIKLSGQAPDQLPTLVPYAKTSDRRSTEPLRADPRKSTTSKRGGQRRVLPTTGLEY
jgi:hypothetical protein